MLSERQEPEITPITTEEFVQAQLRDTFWKSVPSEVGKTATTLHLDRDGVLCTPASLDGSIQRVVPASLKDRVIYLVHYPRLAGHPGETKIYQTLQRNFYRITMSNDIYQTSKDCRSCAAKRSTQRKHAIFLKLFRAAGPLLFGAMDILGPLLRSENGYAHVLVIEDRFPNLTRAIPMRKKTAKQSRTGIPEQLGLPLRESYLLANR